MNKSKQYEIIEDIERKTYSIYLDDKQVRGCWPNTIGGYKNAKNCLIRLQLKNSLNTYVKLWTLLEAHDWTYQYSDDHSKYVSGQGEIRTIKDFVKSHPETVDMYDKYCECRTDETRDFNIEWYINVDNEIKYANIEVY